jgi:hypothetical protein
MSREDFEKDMREYLRTRKKAGFNIKQLLQDLLPKKKAEAVELPEEVEVYHEETEKPKRKEHVLTKFFKKEEPMHEELLRTKMQAEDAIADMKEIAKIALGMINELPDEQLIKFKKSPDFEKMKFLLKKHELIK